MRRLQVMYSNAPPTEGHLERLRDLAAGYEISVATSEEAAIRHAPDTDVVLGHRYLRQVLPHAARLAWVQSTAAGVDQLFGPELMARRPILTRCPVFADVVAKHALTLALSLVRRVPEAVRAQAEGRWSPPFEMLAWPTHAMVIGLGMIGGELVPLLRALGLHVTGVTRDGQDPRALSDRTRAAEDWRDVLPEMDLLFIAIPGSPPNRHFVDRDAMRALPGHAVIVNVGRGSTLDTDALVELLHAGHLGGAGLDVVEPLPHSTDDPIWRVPRLLITPKVSAFAPGRQERLEDFVEAQVRRFLAGEELLDRVPYEVEVPSEDSSA